LRISDAGRRPVTSGPGVPPGGGGPKRPPAQLHGAMTEVIKP